MESFHQVYGQRNSALFTSNYLQNNKGQGSSSAPQESVAQLPKQGSRIAVFRQSMTASYKNVGEAAMNATAFVKNDNAAVNVKNRFAPPLMSIHHHQKAGIGALSQRNHLPPSSACSSSRFSRIFNQSVFRVARPPMMPTIHHSHRRNTEIKMSSTLDKPKMKKEEKTLIHSEAKLFTDELTNDCAHLITTKLPYIPDDPNDPDELTIASSSYQDFNYDHSLFRFFGPGTVLNIDPYFQYIIDENSMSFPVGVGFTFDNVNTGGRLAQIVDNDLGKVLLQSDFRWVQENKTDPGNFLLETGVYVSHKKNQKNGNVTRVVDFINYTHDFITSFNEDGDMSQYPIGLCKDFFFKPKNYQPKLRNVDFFVEGKIWSNYYWGMDNQYLDLKIKDKCVKYELNIPSEYSAQLITVSGQILIPRSNARKGEYLKNGQVVSFSYETEKDQKLQLITVSDDVHLTLLLSKGYHFTSYKSYMKDQLGQRN